MSGELVNLVTETVPSNNLIKQLDLTPGRYVPEFSRVRFGPEVLGSAFKPRYLVTRPDYVQTYSPVGERVDNNALFDKLGAPESFRLSVEEGLRDLGINMRYHSDFDPNTPVEQLIDRALAQLVYAAVSLISGALEGFKRMNPSIVKEYPFPGKLILTTSYPVSPLLTDIIVELVQRQHPDLKLDHAQKFLYILACNGGLKGLVDTFQGSNSPWSVIAPMETAFSLGLSHHIDWTNLSTLAQQKEAYRMFIENAAFSQGGTAVAIMNDAYAVSDVVDTVRYDRRLSLCGPQLFRLPADVSEGSYVYGRPPGNSDTVIKTVKMPPYPEGDFNQMAIFMDPAKTGILFSGLGAEVALQSLQADLPALIEQVRNTGKAVVVDIIAHQPSKRVLDHIVDKINTALTKICVHEGIAQGTSESPVGMIQVRAPWNLTRLGQGNMSSPTTLFNAAETFAEMPPKQKKRLLSLGAWATATAASIQRKTM